TDAAFDFDPTKLTVHVRELGMTGYDAEQWLRDHYNIEVELSDLYNILCLITPGDSKETIDCLLNALAELANEHYKQQADLQALYVKLPEIPQLALTPRDAFYGDVELIPLGQSAGRIIAESIYIYPPGIPILLPGEVIAQQDIRYILEHLKVGLPVKGPEDLTVQNVKVVVEVKAIF